MAKQDGISCEVDNRSLTSELDEGVAPPRSPLLEVPKSPNSPRKPHGTSHGENRLNGQTLEAMSPGDRFRSVVRKVMRLHRTSTWLSSRGAGAEPGVDPRRRSATFAYGHIRENCVIEVCDYSSVRSSFGRMTNKGFIDYLNNAEASAREPWVKVRWINIGGISWDVISAVGLKYDLHPLALEDVLHSTSRKRSKVDYYTRHLFLCVLCHSLAREGEVVPVNPPIAEIPRSASPAPFDEKDMQGSQEIARNDSDNRTKYESSNPTLKKGFKRFFNDIEKGSVNTFAWSLRAMQKAAAREELVRDEITVREFKKEDRVQVKVDPVCLFLTREGTVVSIHPTNNLDFTAPVTARLRQRDTVLRTSADPSLLVQGLLDLIVDQGLEVVDEYHAKIIKLEHEVLLKQKISTIRSLHIISGDLAMHKRTLEPIKTIIYGLRRYDVDRCAALLDQDQSNQKVEGFMSHKAKIYLADVYDHAEYILTSLDLCAGISQNLLNYSFNMASHDMNEVMRRLTLATIIFLPLTLLTHYFGMNFPNMWSLRGQGGHSDVVFWIIALPIMAIILPIFLRRDIVRLVHYLSKYTAAQKAVKTYKQA